MPQPWERRKGETAAQHAWFLRYVGLGPGDRTLDRVSADVGKSRRQIERVSANNRWVDRAAAYDLHEAKQWAARQEAKRRAMCDRHAQLATGFLNRVVTRLQTLRPEDLSTADLARWLEIATRVERTALGLPEATTGVSGPDGGAVQMQVAAMDEDAKRQFFARLVAEANARAGTARPATTGDDDE